MINDNSKVFYFKGYSAFSIKRLFCLMVQEVPITAPTPIDSNNIVLFQRSSNNLADSFLIENSLYNDH